MGPSNLRVLNLNTIEHIELGSPRTQERFSLSAILTEPLGLKNLFVHHERLPPGRRSSSPHAHSHSEEMIVVLSGSVTASLDTVETVLSAGDCVGFPPSTTALHCVWNHTELPASLLVISTSTEADAVHYG